MIPRHTPSLGPIPGSLPPWVSCWSPSLRSMRWAMVFATPSIPIEKAGTMALTEKTSMAPDERHDHAVRTGSPIIDARNVAVTFKVEGGTVDAVKDVSFQL